MGSNSYAKMETMTNCRNTLGYAGEYCVEACSNPEIIKDEWEALQASKTACIYQSYDWVNIACKTFESKNTPFIVSGKDKSGLQFILPMVIEEGFIKTLRWIGGSHANICSGMYSKNFLEKADKNIIEETFKLISASLGGIVIANLNNQPLELSSRPNPLLHLPHQASVNIMYDIDLTLGMDGILDSGSGKRKRKLWRKQNRVAEKMGGFELVIPQTKEDITQALKEFKTFKAARFKDLGIKDIFAEDESINFLIQLAHQPMKDDIQQFRIFQLKIGGETRAIYAVGIFGDYCQAYVNAVKYDEFAEQSPGEMIMYAMLENLIEQGYKKLDMGVGNERYKRSWCPGQHDLFDTIRPMTPIAIPFNRLLQIKNNAKRYVRNNEKIWSIFKKLRKIKGSIFNKRSN